MRRRKFIFRAKDGKTAIAQLYHEICGFHDIIKRRYVSLKER